MLYNIFASAIYACILAICVLALVFGLRARANVKNEKVTALAKGFSPLDVQRIFIGKTYPQKLTRALIVHWAQKGCIRVEYVDKMHVKLIKIKALNGHDKKGAVFFDRGTYVRECEIFRHVFKKCNEKIVNIYTPVISRSSAKKINDGFAVREDVGVYSPLHYTLKIITFILSVAPFFFVGIYYCILTQSPIGIIFPLMMCLGMYVFRFVNEMPFLFKLVWSSGWVIPAVVITIMNYASEVSDPYFMSYASVAILFLGTFVLVRFVDHREKNNLADYSDLVNYRKYLLLSGKTELEGVDYYSALPFLYAFNIKGIAKGKFQTEELPKWYSGEKRSALL